MDSFLKFFIKFEGYAIAILFVYLNFASFFVQVVLFKYPDEVFDYRYFGKYAYFLQVVRIAAGIAMIYGVYKENKKFMYPFAIMFALDLFLLILQDIVAIWVDHPGAEINLLEMDSVVKILFGTTYVTMTLIALGKLFDRETSSKSSGLKWSEFKRIWFRNRAEEMVEEEGVVESEI